MKSGIYMGPAGQLVDVSYFRRSRIYRFSTDGYTWWSFSYPNKDLFEGYQYLGYL